MLSFIQSALLAQTYLSLTHYGSYTCFNLALHFIVFFLPVPVHHLSTLLTNTLSVSIAFHAFGFVIHPAFFPKMRARHGWSIPMFVLGDIVVHTLPAIAHITLLLKKPHVYQVAVRRNPTFGIQSLFLHLAWCIVSTRASTTPFILDRAYVPATPLQWTAALYTVVASHTLISMALLYAFA